jgi:hypothetical protein
MQLWKEVRQTVYAHTIIDTFIHHIHHILHIQTKDAYITPTCGKYCVKLYWKLSTAPAAA